ncbi:baseplate J/gp47 family protein [Anaeromassilibacillus senegalensis]|uniref:baseplate J/gp47 family protein n=1 Tax=Anaeromassilibacillus senegalensis TaxID=1673717 RepID=UPI00067FC00D|nr:baseplate J/gp47 family protein [Anaeromassilibacillus senegalensis]
MSRNVEYQFVSTDTETLIADLVSAYEKITGTSVKPASPEKLFIQWVASIILQERILNNYTGNQNIPSRAEGENLDALGELFFVTERPEAQSAVCTERFYISATQSTAILIPSGTRVTDTSNALVWETVSDVYVPIGSLYVDAQLRCQTPGAIGNGYAIGQLNNLVDLFDYYDHCENITVSDDGADEATDDEYYELMRASTDGYSCAGAKGGYVYFAKQVSTEIADVVANRPSDGCVALYILMDDGSIATTEIKNAVLAACNPDYVRPLTDRISVADPETVNYNITFTYYISRDTSISSTEIQQSVDAAVKEYTVWQCGKLGRDINPSYLIGLLMQTGIKRVELTSPSFIALRDGADNTVPQVAAVNTIAVTDGGHEDE